MPEIVAGLDKLLTQLRNLDYALQRTALLGAAQAGAEIIREEAARLAPVGETGRLSEEMTMQSKLGVSDIHEATVNVGPAKDTFYGFFQEFGTVFEPAQPFLEPALEAKREEATNAMKEELLRQIKKVAA